MVGVEIVPLTPDRWDDLVTLFRQDRDPRWCWCMYWRLRSRDFGANRVSDNRAALNALTIDAAGGERPAPGLLAYRGEQPVGWVSLGPRQDFERVAASRMILPIDDRPVWSVVCFVVGPGARGEGIAGALLEAAVSFARDHGAPALEAYPIDTDGARMRAAGLWTGTLGTFERTGFRIVGSRLDQAGRPRPDRPIVQLELG
jgi:GNAT superfamily N-acetyltransferase